MRCSTGSIVLRIGASSSSHAFWLVFRYFIKSILVGLFFKSSIEIMNPASLVIDATASASEVALRLLSFLAFSWRL